MNMHGNHTNKKISKVMMMITPITNVTHHQTSLIIKQTAEMGSSRNSAACISNSGIVIKPYAIKNEMT